MSNFLFIIPEGWERLEGEVLNDMDVNVVISMVNNADYANLTDRMREFGALAPNEICLEGRVFESLIFAYRKVVDL